MFSRLFASACLAAGALADSFFTEIQYISTNAPLPKIIHMGNIDYGLGVRPTIPELVANVSEVLLMAQIGYHVSPSIEHELVHLPEYGRANFYQAVAAAVSPETSDRGGLIVLNDRITGVFYATKSDANTPDTFKSYPTNRPHFNVTNTTVLPSVITLYSHQGFDASLMFAAVANGAKGLVIMGADAAALMTQATANAAVLTKQGIPVVAAPHPVIGAGPPAITPGDIYVLGEQARIMLQLAINANHTMDQIHDLFQGALYNTIFNTWANRGSSSTWRGGRHAGDGEGSGGV
ncbi:hypothetical protein SBRCBS47491_001843 [Sporothrix bragantina]|uniref:asparaginase n=1 Tax=Sporothrix bragantina TaxID=671064 RepID=A0ABP0B1Z2_9PEZI